jgi:hypothetical protein
MRAGELVRTDWMAARAMDTDIDCGRGAETGRMSSADIFRLNRGKVNRLAQAGLDSLVRPGWQG